MAPSRNKLGIVDTDEQDFDPANKPEREDAPVAGAGVQDFAQSIGARNLMIIIVTMPLVFIIVVMGIIGFFGSPGDEEAPAAAQTLIEPAPIAAEVTQVSQPGQQKIVSTQSAAAASPLTVPAGATIATMTLAGDELAVHVSGPAGDEIIIYDTKLGETKLVIPVLRETP